MTYGKWEKRGHGWSLTLSRRGSIMAPLPRICLPLLQGKGYVNQTCWLCSFWFLPGPKKPFLLFFKKLKELDIKKFLGSSSFKYPISQFQKFIPELFNIRYIYVQIVKNILCSYLVAKFLAPIDTNKIIAKSIS